MKIGFVERLMRRLGLSAGQVDYKTDRARELEGLLDDADAASHRAVYDFDKTARDLQLQGFEIAQQLTETRQAVKGVTDRLSPLPSRSRDGNDEAD